MRSFPRTITTSLLLLLPGIRALDAAPATRPSNQRAEQDAALAEINEELRAAPLNPRAFLARAAIHAAQRQWAKAAEDYASAIALTPDAAKKTDLYHRRGEAQFRAGQIDGCLLDFDVHLKHHPEDAPGHWQRGLALYYAGRYAEGRKQFELHQTVNPNDVENSAWHYLCVARLEGVEKARAALIPTGGDRRVPMMQVHALLAGKATPQDVFAAAKATNPDPDERGGPLFYAHLYLGLYHEAAGESAKAREHILLAEQHAGDDYMGDTARVHATRLRSAATTAPAAK